MAHDPNENGRDKAPNFHVMDTDGNERGQDYRETFDNDTRPQHRTS
jgi:hypothetical protein